MADQSAFDQNKIEASAMSETSGILDELNLPPAVVSFLRKNKRMLWTIVAIVGITITAVSLYGSYRTYQAEHADSALDAALQVQGTQRAEMLQQVLDKYASAPSAPWAGVELAKIAVNTGDLDTAIAELQSVNTSITAKDPLKPLVLNILGGLQEKKQDYTAAIGFYQELSAFPGFIADAHYALGRVYTSMGKKTEAIDQYKKYLTLTETDNGAMTGQPDPQRALVEHIIKQLQ